MLADNIAEKNIYSYRNPIPESIAIAVLADDINKELGRLIGVAFRVGVMEVINEEGLRQFNKNPQYVIAKEFVKMTESKAEQIMGILASANSLHFHSNRMAAIRHMNHLSEFRQAQFAPLCQ